MTTTSVGGPGRVGPLGGVRMRAACRTRNVFWSRGRRWWRGSLSPAAMASPALCRSPMPPPAPLLLPLLLSVALLGAQARAEPPAAGSAVPAQSRPCVDCHAFEFMQRALQDLRKTAYSLDSRTDTLLLQAERRALCACWPAGR
ncbi:NELL2-interacting cell ontogeny regulator 1 [Tenrec ecaudatus]|uniref:NELL2-interacting cell ontogeny regulator 1 n=1 Tax=Tenrec ecaudatus TaxID=94439 RepID=UPI003F5A2BD0